MKQVKKISMAIILCGILLSTLCLTVFIPQKKQVAAAYGGNSGDNCSNIGLITGISGVGDKIGHCILDIDIYDPDGEVEYMPEVEEEDGDDEETMNFI